MKTSAIASAQYASTTAPVSSAHAGERERRAARRARLRRLEHARHELELREPERDDRPPSTE